MAELCKEGDFVPSGSWRRRYRITPQELNRDGKSRNELAPDRRYVDICANRGPGDEANASPGQGRNRKTTAFDIAAK